MVIVACTDDAERIERLENEIALLREERSAESAGTMTPAPVATARPTRTATATPAPDPTAETLSEPLLRWIARTGGVGVSLRSDCLADARTPGSWPEATEVVVTQQGLARCSGWSLVRAGIDETWIDDRYLSTAKPPPPPTATVGPVAPPAATPTQPPATPVASPPAAPSLTPWEAYAATQCAYYQQQYLAYAQGGASPTFLTFIRSKISEWC